MAASIYKQEQYPCRNFVESAGAVLFDFRHIEGSIQHLSNLEDLHSIDKSSPKSTQEPSIALFYHSRRKETLLPKGRRNINEPRSQAALREIFEETGLRCSLLPIVLNSRATSVDLAQDRTNTSGYTTNEVRHFKNTTDPFWMTIRHGAEGRKTPYVKVIWWYIAVVEDLQSDKAAQLDPGCELRLLPATRAQDACTFEDDRRIVKEAIDIVQKTLGVSWDNNNANRQTQ